MNPNPNTSGLKPPWKKGEAPPRAGRPTAGATIREWINQLAANESTEEQLREVARNKREPWTKRAAAERILRTLESGDLADMEKVLEGEQTLSQLRESGTNTEIIKKIKVRHRTTKAGDHEVEREIELFDRAGSDFDRVVDTTAGRPVQPVANATPNDEMSDDELREACERLGMPIPPALKKDA